MFPAAPLTLSFSVARISSLLEKAREQSNTGPAPTAPHPVPGAARAPPSHRMVPRKAERSGVEPT